ncbi:MAG: hypothetical protein ACYC9I_08415 [Desulfuromonadales bacterium]
MLIQCLIERDGDTVVTRGAQNYVFRANRNGHAVCEVQNDDHARLFLRMGPRHYRPYGAQAELHARALKMIPKQTVLEEFEEDGEVFEESVGIVEGRQEQAQTEDEPGEDEGEDEPAGLFGVPDEPGEPSQDPLVRDVAVRLMGQGIKKAEVAKQLQGQFGLSSSDALQVVSEVTKK